VITRDAAELGLSNRGGGVAGVGASCFERRSQAMWDGERVLGVHVDKGALALSLSGELSDVRVEFEIGVPLERR